MKRLPDRRRPEYDTSQDPDAEWRPYIVCSTPRSGSQLLCRGLAGTGIAGVPMEYFNRVNRRPLSTRWGCGESLNSYLQALRAHRTTSNGVFGTKLHWDQLDIIRAETLGQPTHEAPFTLDSGFLDSLFPNARYVYIRRLDVNRQAVSRWIAHQSMVWEVGDEPHPSGAPVHYSFAGIERHRQHILLGDIHWDRYFHLNGIRPREVVYEDLAEDYEGVLRDVVTYVVPDARTIEIGPPETLRAGAARTDAFTERFGRDLVRRGIQGPSISERLSNQAHRAARRIARSLPLR